MIYIDWEQDTINAATLQVDSEKYTIMREDGEDLTEHEHQLMDDIRDGLDYIRNKKEG